MAVDDEVIVENNNSIAVFNYSFKLDSYYFNLVQINDSKYDLKINDNFFHDIMEAENSGELKEKIYNKNRSKVLHEWKFILKGTYHEVKLWDSRLSGKKKLAVDDEVIVENNNSIAVFNYSFRLDSYYFNLVQIDDSKYDLKINDNWFHDIMKAEKSGDLKKNIKTEKKQPIYKESDKEESDYLNQDNENNKIRGNNLIDDD